jgi:hypothetical protein
MQVVERRWKMSACSNCCVTSWAGMAGRYGCLSLFDTPYDSMAEIVVSLLVMYDVVGSFVDNLDLQNPK